MRVVCWASEIIFVSRTDAWGSGSSAFSLTTFGLGLPFAFTKQTRRSTSSCSVDEPSFAISTVNVTDSPIGTTAV